MKHSDSIPWVYGKIYPPNASPLQIASLLIMFNVVSIPDRDFNIFQHGYQKRRKKSSAVSIPDRDFSIFQLPMPETLTVFSFQGSFATTSRIISFQILQARILLNHQKKHLQVVATEGIKPNHFPVVSPRSVLLYIYRTHINSNRYQRLFRFTRDLLNSIISQSLQSRSRFCTAQSSQSLH